MLLLLGCWDRFQSKIGGYFDPNYEHFPFNVTHIWMFPRYFYIVKRYLYSPAGTIWPTIDFKSWHFYYFRQTWKVIYKDFRIILADEHSKDERSSCVTQIKMRRVDAKDDRWWKERYFIYSSWIRVSFEWNPKIYTFLQFAIDTKIRFDSFES
jgi:hypothetical protein